MTTVSQETIEEFRTNIHSIFGDNLLFSFIGGSVANGIDKETSDIDTFIVTKKTILDQEKKYYNFFKKMHQKLNRPCDHPGFIMNLSTIYNLFSIFEQYGRAVPNIKSANCVKEDCILSQYSNSKVILWFFQDKQIILKHHPLLDAFNGVMKNYQEQVSYDKTKKYQPRPVFKHSALHQNLLKIKHHYEKLVNTDEVQKTPWGINVEKFFTPSIIRHSYDGKITSDYECPLCDPNIEPKLKKILSKQCIALKLSKRKINFRE